MFFSNIKNVKIDAMFGDMFYDDSKFTGPKPIKPADEEIAMIAQKLLLKVGHKTDFIFSRQNKLFFCEKTKFFAKITYFFSTLTA